MASNVLFIGWNRAIVGREKSAAESFGAANTLLEKSKAAGKIESWETILLERHGGDLNGFFLVRGDRAKLSEMIATDEWRDLLVRADHSMNGLGYITGWTGEGVAKEFGRWQKVISST